MMTQWAAEMVSVFYLSCNRDDLSRIGEDTRSSHWIGTLYPIIFWEHSGRTNYTAFQMFRCWENVALTFSTKTSCFCSEVIKQFREIPTNKANQLGYRKHLRIITNIHTNTNKEEWVNSYCISLVDDAYSIELFGSAMEKWISAITFYPWTSANPFCGHCPSYYWWSQ